MREGITASILSGIMLVIFVIFVIIAGVAADQVFLEPNRQNSYVFKVTENLNTWCSASPTDPFNMGTLTALKTARDSNAQRYGRLTAELKQTVDAAIRGDRFAACGHE